MRISDWSSDVCSSDLEGILADLDHILAHAKELNMRLRYEVRQPLGDLLEGGGRIARTIPPIAADGVIATDAHEIAQAADIAGQRCEKTFHMIDDQQPGVGKFEVHSLHTRDHIREYARRVRTAVAGKEK